MITGRLSTFKPIVGSLLSLYYIIFREILPLHVNSVSQPGIFERFSFSTMATAIAPREKGWKVMIKTSDGTSNEVMVPATPGKVPVSAEVQEIDVVASEKKADPEKNDGKSKEVSGESSYGRDF